MLVKFEQEDAEVIDCWNQDKKLNDKSKQGIGKSVIEIIKVSKLSVDDISLFFYSP